MSDPTLTTTAAPEPRGPYPHARVEQGLIWITGQIGRDPASGLIVEGGFGPEHVNVSAQRRDPDSLLSFMTLLVRRYRECPELGWGAFAVLDQPHPQVLAHSVTWDDACLVALHNLSADPVTVPLGLAEPQPGTRLVDLLCDGARPRGGRLGRDPVAGVRLPVATGGASRRAPADLSVL